MSLNINPSQHPIHNHKIVAIKNLLNGKVIILFVNLLPPRVLVYI